MGFGGYFLIVWDLIRHAREQGIRVGPGRGSAAGSVVSYALRITDLDPLRYGLLFERFLNPDRIQMPDIDMDFDERRRDEVIRYATEKYGADHVAQIVTFQTIKGKQGIRDAARVLGFPPAVGDRLCKMYPPAVMGRDYPIEDALKLSPDLANAYEREPEAKEIVETARALEGLRREDSVHAAGVVIGDAPLVNYLPLKLSKDSRDDSKKVVTQYDMNGVEALGLLKMDFLGLRNLSVIEDTLRHLRARGVDLDIDHVALDDPETYAMLQRAETTGVFQMESAGMRNLIKVLKPDRFEDLMALVALYRPGPLNSGLHTEYAERKHGRRKVSYPHDDLEPILRDTYGVMIYQEQVMQVAVALAGFSMSQADTLRKAMGKKKLDVLMPFKEQFIAGAVDKGYPRKLADDMFEMIVPFADYGFNASHACAYGYVAYQTAYLMAHHPVEYMSAILTSVKDDKDRKPYYLYACRSMDIEVLPPDVNESEPDFAPAPGDAAAIRYGLSAVRNVGEGAVAKIIEARRAGGAFTSFSDFCRKVDPGVLTKRVLESLVQAGAFDSLGYSRQGLLQSQDKVSAPILAERKAEAAGQFSLFGGDGDDGGAATIDESVLEAEEFDKRTLLRLEKEMLGQFVTDHPLLEVREALAATCSHEIADLDGLGDGDLVTIGGIIGAVARKYTKRGEPYAQFRLEGLAGGVGVVAFPSVYEAVPGMIETDRIVLAVGRIDLRGRELQIRATEVREPDLGRRRPRRLDARCARRRPAGGGVHALRARQAQGAVRGASGRCPRAGPVPLLHGRDAAPGGHLPGAPGRTAAGGAAIAARRRRGSGRPRSRRRGRRGVVRPLGRQLVGVDVEARAADAGAERADERRFTAERGGDGREALAGAGDLEQRLAIVHQARDRRGQHVARGHGIVRNRSRPADRLAGDPEVGREGRGGDLDVVGARTALVGEGLDVPDGVGILTGTRDQPNAIAACDVELERSVGPGFVGADRDRDADSVRLVRAPDLLSLADGNDRERATGNDVANERAVSLLEHTQPHRGAREQDRVNGEDGHLHDLIMAAAAGRVSDHGVRGDPGARPRRRSAGGRHGRRSGTGDGVRR